MNEQELMKSIEDAKTIDEVWNVASKAGVDRASFDAMIQKASKEQDEEISEIDLESVAGGSWILRIGLYIYAKITGILPILNARNHNIRKVIFRIFIQFYIFKNFQKILPAQGISLSKTLSVREAASPRS